MRFGHFGHNLCICNVAYPGVLFLYGVVKYNGSVIGIGPKYDKLSVFILFYNSVSSTGLKSRVTSRHDCWQQIFPP